jgi:predicted metal-dependent phosphoesterase TrpH
MTPADYREEGFDFFFSTDHNRMYTSEYAAKLYEGIPLGMEILRGEEVHTPGSLLHIVHAGGRESVCDRYISDPAGYERELDALEESLSHIDPQYRRRYAMAKWACDRIHEAGGIAILAHPYWRPNANNLANEFIDLLYDEKLFDAFEVLGGIGSVHNNMQLALWHQKCLEGKRLSVVASSDSHDHDSEKGIFARRFTLVFAKENTNEAILQGVREGFSVAGEIPAGDSKEVRFYGDLRLVNFAHFLFQNYFNETWRLCVGEGILMRRYAEGEDVGQLLAALAPTVEDFYKRFYGLVEQQGLPACRRAYLQQLRQIQQTKGPITKGSQLYIYGGNERRE